MSFEQEQLISEKVKNLKMRMLRKHQQNKLTPKTLNVGLKHTEIFNETIKTSLLEKEF